MSFFVLAFVYSLVQLFFGAKLLLMASFSPLLSLIIQFIPIILILAVLSMVVSRMGRSTG